MYKRPNAPFKPPRPFASAQTGTTDSSVKKEPQLFVPEAASDVSEQNDQQLSENRPVKTQAKIAQRASLKRMKPNPVLVRRTNSQQGGISSENVSKSRPESPSNLSSTSSTSLQDQSKKYYSVQWRKRTNKKNKSWDGDGFVVASDTGLVLRIQLSDESYKLVGRTKNTSLDGVFSIGMYEVEVDCETTRENIFGSGDSVSVGLFQESSSSIHNEQPIINNAFKHHAVKSNSTESNNQAGVPAAETQIENTVVSPDPESDPPVNSLILPRLDVPNGKSVVVDERLTKYLRLHQREGVSFLYECLMGIRNENQYGALLADEMGLGKTLMTITLIWTLLKQSPLPSEKNVINKVLICCPVSLIENWRKEFGKWLDLNRIGILALNNKTQSAAKDKQDIVNFGKTKVYQVLIMNYEKFLACSNELSTVNIDLLVCDEGHRLKSSANKVLKFMNGLPVRKRLVLTGTPIQNDLNEFYNIVNFINPGLLGTMPEFQKEFLKPILRARDVNCYDANIAQQGREKSALLIEITKTFTIRRTKAVIEDYLTAKTDILLFCPPTKLQKKLFLFVIETMGFNSLVSSGTREVLPAINLLRKICNSPSLLAEDNFYNSLVKKNPDTPAELMPSVLPSRTTGSKMNITIPLLLQFRNAGENVVLVSNYTQTLDLLERVLLKLNFLYARLDGSTPLATRDTLVTSFNKAKKYNVFLLSAKAGGIGLNLIGASRLILFDNDWNPSIDIQAMARIHRDGQKKPVFIYRLFTTGSIDEKIFQRQLMKNNLSDMFLDDNLDSSLNIFEYEDLRDLFTVVDSSCNTHDLIDCECLGQGDEISLSQATMQNDDLSAPSMGSQTSATQGESSQAHRTSSSGWMSALEYKDLDQTDSAKTQTIRSALSHYRHFDPKRFSGKVDTGDDILNSLIPKAEGDLSYIFTHQKIQKS